ncbi:MAG: hypothetical protein O2794_02260 [bacterium]|nr:hypothetical protein [bacterium]
MEELKNAIKESSSAIIVLPDHASDKDYLAALQLQKIAEDKIHVLAPSDKEESWQQIFNTESRKKEFAITIDTKVTPVEELRYEKNGTSLIIYLSHRQKFDQKAISCAAHLPPSDLFVTIGFSSQEEAEVALEPLPHKGVARHLWIEDKNTAPALTAETPGDYVYDAPVRSKLAPAQAALLGRFMVRSREDFENDILWSFITREDFSKTGTSMREILLVIQSYVEIASHPPTLAIFWQHEDQKGTHGIVWSTNEQLLENMADEFDIVIKTQHVELPEFANFIEAETTVRKLLRLAL